MAEIQPQLLKTLRSDMALQKINQGKRRTHRIDLDFSDIHESFIGTITVHHPSQMEKLQVGVLKSQLLGGVQPVDTMTDNIATIVATLDVVIDSKPEWFDVFDDMLEYEILEKVYLEYIKWVNSFRRRDNQPVTEGDSQQ